MKSIYKLNYTSKTFATGTDDEQIPDAYGLSSNYPNPFNPVTIVNYQLPEDAHVVMKLYDVVGREIRTLVNENKEAGYYRVAINASDLASGVYYYRFTTGSYVAVKKLVLTK